MLDYSNIKHPWQQKGILEDLYTKEGLSMKQVGERLGCSAATILKWLERNNIETRTKTETTLEQLPPELSNKSQLEKMYIEEGLSTTEISEKMCGVSITKVQHWLDYHNIETRSRGGSEEVPELQSEDFLHQLYIEDEKSTVEIADEYGCSTTLVLRWLSKFGIETRERWCGNSSPFPHSQEFDYYYGPNWDEKKEEIRNRDDYECQKCSISEKVYSEEYGRCLDVHHIKRFLSFAPFYDVEDYEEANNENNLISLCRSCHREVESDKEKLPINI